jgi:hypothetical protein
MRQYWQSKALACVVGTCAVAGLAAGAQAQAGGAGNDQTQRNLTPPPPPPPAPPRNRSGELGGVKMKLANPYSNRGSLLEQRMRPMPGLVNPGQQLPPQSPNLVAPVPVTDGWIIRPGIASGGASIEIDSDGVRRIRLSPPSAVGVVTVRDGVYWKYPLNWYRSNRWDDRYYAGWHAVGDASQKPDRFLKFQPEVADYANPDSELPEIERAERAMRAGDWKAAITLYRDHIALAPSDAGSLRLIGIALVLEGKVNEGVLSIVLAHQREPELGRKAMDLDVVRNESDVARATSAIMNHAMRVKTAEAMLAAAVVKHATDAKSVAVRMLDRAKAAGLSATVESEVRAGLSAMK